MGAWGLEVEQNDHFLDVYGEFYDEYNSGESAEDAATIITEGIEGDFDPYEDLPPWCALCFAKWETKILTEADITDLEDKAKLAMDIMNAED